VLATPPPYNPLWFSARLGFFSGFIGDRGVNCSRLRSYADVLFGAEAEAKAAKRGLWESFVEVQAADERAERGDELVSMKVCEVIDGSQFFAHTSVDEAKVRGRSPARKGRGREFGLAGLPLPSRAALVHAPLHPRPLGSCTTRPPPLAWPL
jgi:hypothetical protein